MWPLFFLRDFHRLNPTEKSGGQAIGPKLRPWLFNARVDYNAYLHYTHLHEHLDSYIARAGYVQQERYAALGLETW